MKGGNIKSEKWYYCGPASLQWALARCGVSRSQQALARRCKTTQRRGTSNSRLAAAPTWYGLSATVQERVSWKKLISLVRLGSPVIVGWYSDFNEPFGSHFSGVLKVTDTSITLMDPELGAPRTMSRRFFLKRWHDYDSAKRRSLRRWLVAIGL